MPPKNGTGRSCFFEQHQIVFPFAVTQVRPFWRHLEREKEEEQEIEKQYNCCQEIVLGAHFGKPSTVNYLRVIHHEL